MGKIEFTAEEKIFLGGTPFRWIGICKVSYNDSDLTKELENALNQIGLRVSRKGTYSTEFVKTAN